MHRGDDRFTGEASQEPDATHVTSGCLKSRSLRTISCQNEGDGLGDPFPGLQ